VLTDDREGQEYLEQTALPQLSNSPTGRAVIEALLEHAPVKMLIIPEFARDISEWVQTHTGKGLPNLQPFGRLVIMYSPSQPGHIFAHEAIHLMARQTGVDPWSIAGGSGRPGFSLQMEREAMIVESTIKFELETRATERQLISEDIRVLTNLQDHQAAFAKVDELGGQVYGWFPEGNTPVRDWRADLLDLGLGQETIVAIVEAAWSGPRP